MAFQIIYGRDYRKEYLSFELGFNFDAWHLVYQERFGKSCIDNLKKLGVL